MHNYAFNQTAHEGCRDATPSLLDCRPALYFVIIIQAKYKFSCELNVACV